MGERDLEERLRESEERLALFESIMDSMGESILLVDRKGKEIYGNRELRRFRGEVDPGQDLDRWRRPDRMRIFDVDGKELPPEDWPVARALRGDFKTNFEIRVQGMAHTQDEVVLAISTRSLIDSSGRVEGAVIVTRDITSVRQTEDKLRQSQKLETIGQLTGGVAHDFNNMLAAILSAAEVLKRGVSGNDRLELAASTIEKATLRGADLTRQLLAFARRQSLNPVSLDVEALVRETLLLARPALGATIDVHVRAEGGVYALVDPSLLTSALLNLCINARDAMGDRGGSLTISVDRGDIAGIEGPTAKSYARISVADTGSGMSPEIMKRAIEPFFTTKEIGKGSGLGLSMVYGFARQSGGDLRIESEIGRGTTMTLLLPFSAAPAPAAHDTDHASEPRGALKVLVVDDDELVRDALCLQLNDAGFETIAAADGPEALDLVGRGVAFDLLFTDIVMPRGMSGLALAAAVREKRPEVRAIISTGYVDKDLPDDGGWLLLRKPYTAVDLFAALRAAMLGPR